MQLFVSMLSNVGYPGCGKVLGVDKWSKVVRDIEWFLNRENTMADPKIWHTCRGLFRVAGYV